MAEHNEEAAKISELEMQLAAVTTEKADLEARLAGMRSENGDMKAKIIRMQAEKEEIKAKLAATQAELSVVRVGLADSAERALILQTHVGESINPQYRARQSEVEGAAADGETGASPAETAPAGMSRNGRGESTSCHPHFSRILDAVALRSAHYYFNSLMKRRASSWGEMRLLSVEALLASRLLLIPE